MRNFAQFCRKCPAVFALTFVLTCTAFAGDMQHPVVSSSVTTSGAIPYPGVTVDPVIEIALSLLQGASLLF